MRLLFLTPFLPDAAASHGGGIYVASLAKALAEQAELGLVALLRPDEQARLASHAAPWQWQATAALTERPAAKGKLSHQLRMLWQWRRLPLVAAKAWHPGIPALIERARAEFRPDVVMLELAQMAQYLPFLSGLPTILTDHEAGCPANTRTGLGPWGDRRDEALWRRYVARLYPLASLIQAVTPEDAASLSQRLGRNVLVRPPTLVVPATRVEPALAPARALFLGDYRHEPNPEAAAELVRSVLPRLRAVEPNAELWLAGPNEDRVRHLADTPGVRVLGFVPDLPTLFAQVRLMLAPLWSGAGFRVKALAALAHGLPVVTNNLGARGCTAPSPACQVVEGPQALADAALGLLCSSEAAGQAGSDAFAWARANLCGTAVARVQVERAEQLLGKRF